MQFYYRNFTHARNIVKKSIHMMLKLPILKTILSCKSHNEYIGVSHRKKECPISSIMGYKDINKQIDVIFIVILMSNFFSFLMSK